MPIALVLYFFFNATCFAQKRFRVTLQFPQQLDLTKLSLAYDDGKTQIQIKAPASSNGKMIVTGSFYSKYAALILRYPKKLHLNYGNSFFLSDKPAQIFFKEVGTANSPFDNYKLVNAYDYKTEKDKMKKNTFGEVKNLEDFLDSLGEKFEPPLDSLLQQNWDSKNKKLFEKGLEYVSKTGNSYYSFWYFRRNLSYPTYITADSVLRFFDTNFPDSFKKSEEGNTIKSLLHGMMVKKGNTAPNFTCKDMNEKSISLYDYRGKKYVLLTFWATWCGPCIEEIPVIRSIKEKYSIQNLEIISVSYQSTYLATANLIKKEKMKWINIYNDTDLINAWGGTKAIPRVYLIDKLGKIIYDRDVDDPGNLELPVLKQYLNQLQ